VREQSGSRLRAFFEKPESHQSLTHTDIHTHVDRTTVMLMLRVRMKTKLRICEKRSAIIMEIIEIATTSQIYTNTHSNEVCRKIKQQQCMHVCMYISTCVFSGLGLPNAKAHTHMKAFEVDDGQAACQRKSLKNENIKIKFNYILTLSWLLMLILLLLLLLLLLLFLLLAALKWNGICVAVATKSRTTIRDAHNIVVVVVVVAVRLM